MSEQQRPSIVRAFESLSIALIGLELIFISGVTWDDVVWVPIIGWIVLSISRRRSSIARWILTALFASGVALMAFVIANEQIPLADIGWAAWLMTFAGVVQLALLWTPEMSKWIGSKADDASRIGAQA